MRAQLFAKYTQPFQHSQISNSEAKTKKSLKMRSFEGDKIEKQPISQELLRIVRAIGEYKGKQDLYREQSPQILKTLQQQAIIESAESSNRIEGVTAPRARILEIVQEQATLSNRSEQEIAGYRRVLEMIHTSALDMRLTSGLVLQLHRDLYQFSPSSIGGQWKQGDNAIFERLPGGGRRVRFETVPAHLTETAMNDLHTAFRAQWDAGEIEHLLLIATYALDFLCIHPFTDGNGRMVRLLSLMLLYQAGYEVGRFISLERKIEETKDGYYETLRHASVGWHEGEHDLTRWWNYFLGVVVLGAYKEFESRVGTITEGYGSKQALVLHFIDSRVGRFTVGDIELGCPAVSRATINRLLNKLAKEKKLRLGKLGRNAVWEKTKKWEKPAESP